jgi:DNA-binding transcriptional MerR regulator
MSVTPAYSLEELVVAVNAWCETHNLTPANGQSAEQLSARTLRYYRTMGLLSAPVSGGGAGYGEIHRLQLLAVRVLQAQGLPLSRIQRLLYARSMADLHKILDKGVTEMPREKSWPQMAAAEDWRVTPIDDSIWLIARHGRSLTPEQLERIRAIVDSSALENLLELENERKS